MKAMILAAGVGSRLDPLTRNIPKPMVPIVNRPVIEHIVRLLAKHGFHRVMVNLHHLPQQIRQHLGDGTQLGVHLTYSEETELLGTAGGIKKVEDFFDDTFLVIGGDDLADIDLTTLLKFHREKRALATIALALVDDPSEYGVAVLDKRGRIAHFIEKPKGERLFSNTVNTGVYVFEPEILNLIPQNKFFDFGRDVFPLLLQQKEPFYGYLTSSYWCDVGNLTQYRQSHYDALQSKVALELPYRQVRRYVWIGEDVEIDPTAEVGYPVAIGDRCRIGPHARVLEDSVLGNDCVVQAKAIITKSILWEKARVGEETMLHRCIVGSGCHVKSNAAIFDGVIVNPNHEE